MTDSWVGRVLIDTGDRILDESLFWLRWHFHPEWGDRGPLDILEVNGKPMTRLPSRGRAMLFALKDGQTVRARTCNDNVLIAVADKPTEGAKINIEGTDWILIVMPETARTHGNVIAYLVPTREDVKAVRLCAGEPAE